MTCQSCLGAVVFHYQLEYRGCNYDTHYFIMQNKRL